MPLPGSEAAPTEDPCTAYAQAVVAGEVLAGWLVVEACKRHLRDLIEGPARGLVWRQDLAARAYSFFAALNLAEGAHAGQPFYLELFQCFIVGSLFGWLGADGYRRYRTGYIEIGKGNGKTPLAAGIGLYGLVADGEQGAEIYSAAVSRDQASICFRDAKRFVQANPALARRLVIGTHNIAYPLGDSYFRPLSAEGKTLDGKRVHMALVDEVHEHPSAVVVDKIRAGTKGRRQALILEITNSGTDRNSICFQHHDYSRRVLQAKPGDKDFDDGWFAYVCTLDPCADHFAEGRHQPVDGCDRCDSWMKDPRVWHKANPNLGVSIPVSYLEQQVQEARGMPAKQNIVARLNFCIWTDAIAAWISKDKWDAVQAALVRAAFRGRKCHAALDLSSRKDLTAAALFFPDDKGGGDAFLEFWTPAQGLAEREERDRAPYAQWVKDGHLRTTPGASVDYEAVAARMGALSGEHEIAAAAYDRWRIEDLKRELSSAGVKLELVPFGQGFKDMAPAVDALEAMILNGRIRIHRNPVLTWNAASAVIESDAAGNRKFTKRKATGRIDGLVALTMAVGASTLAPQAPVNPYKKRGFRFL